MCELEKLIDEITDETLILAVLSGRRRSAQCGGANDPLLRVRIRPVLINHEVLYQAEEFRGRQAFHHNMSAPEAKKYMLELLTDTFSQLQVQSAGMNLTALVNRKGALSVKRRRTAEPKPVALQAHNRTKRYVLQESVYVPFLEDLGVMTQDGRIIRSRYDKFRQINRFLEYIQDILPSLDTSHELTIIDFGCGKSYLTFAVYYYLHELLGLSVRIIGLDLKSDVIAECSRLASEYGYTGLKFLCGDIADYEGVDSVDMVITLHACDTATDYALAKAVKWGARCILSVPCCQHELAAQLDNDLLRPLLSYGIVKERMAALMTDALRAQLLEQCGYRTQLLEFIDMAHTPKNILIRAVFDGHSAKPEERAQLDAICREFRLTPSLVRLLGYSEK